MNDYLDVAPEIADALADGRPVLALESTIITHGMPYPQNLATARAVEQLVRDGGAVPATIAVLGGRIAVGLRDRQLEQLAASGDVMKLSRADLAFALSERKPGSTTVAATMICARLAGMDVFATGGIGGVHRGAELSFDVSADLQELARTDILVVCAGAKALLDLPKTLEVLETLGVPVVGYGTDELPAFWSRQSGLRAPLRLDEPEAIARFFATRRALGIAGGMMVANPVPEADEIPAAEMNPVIEAAIAAAERDGIKAKAVTPYVLDSVLKLTNGRSLVTNMALIRNNARLGAEVAVAVAALMRDRKRPQ